MSVDGWRIVPVLTNLFILPAWYFLIRNYPRLYLEFLYTALMFTVSFAYHLCRFLGEPRCLISLGDIQAVDHAMAEGLVLLMGVLFLHLHDLPRRHSLFLTLFVLNVAWKWQVGHDGWTMVPAVAVGSLLALAGVVRDWQHFRHAYIGAGFVLLAVGSVFFLLRNPDVYVWAHSLWHTIVFLGLFIILQGIDVRLRTLHMPEPIVDVIELLRGKQ